MSDVGRPRTPRRQWLLISGVVVVAALAVAGWFTLQGTRQTAPAAAADKKLTAEERAQISATARRPIIEATLRAYERVIAITE